METVLLVDLFKFQISHTQPIRLHVNVLDRSFRSTLNPAHVRPAPLCLGHRINVNRKVQLLNIGIITDRGNHVGRLIRILRIQNGLQYLVVLVIWSKAITQLVHHVLGVFNIDHFLLVADFNIFHFSNKKIK